MRKTSPRSTSAKADSLSRSKGGGGSVAADQEQDEGSAGDDDAHEPATDLEGDDGPRDALVVVPDAPELIEPPDSGRSRGSPVQRFLAEARRYPRLSEAEERGLIGKVRTTNDTDAAKKLVIHNLRLVISIAYQYRQAWTNVLDLFQEGSVGLMEAVKRWDPDMGTRFGSYGAYWIRAYILRFLMTNARLIHVGNTRAGRKLFFRLERERQKLLAAGFDVTPKLLAAKLDVDEKDLEEVSAHLASREVSFDPQPEHEGEGLGLAERVSSGAVSPEAAAARGEISANLSALMARFESELSDQRERAIWKEHLAATEDPLPLSELGARFGVSKQRMGQIADRLKKRFREILLANMGEEIQLQWQPED